MSENDSEILEVLKAELNFIEKGGYGRSVHTPWQPTSVFRDSLSCLNFAMPERIHPCKECLLYSLIPQESQKSDIPCHDIPLNESGETLTMLEQSNDQAYMEEVVKRWLHTTIKKLEEKEINQGTSN